MNVLILLVLIPLVCFAEDKPRGGICYTGTAHFLLKKQLESLASETERRDIAFKALEDYPDNIEVGRIAQDAVLPSMENPVEWFRTRSDRLKTVASRYLYARAANDFDISVGVANEILKKDRNDYWGLRLMGAALAAASPDSIPRAIEYLERAIVTEPRRPDTYLYTGFYYKQLGQDDKAIKAFEAGAVCDPSDKIIRDFRLTHYATHKMPDEYFALVPQALPSAPLDLDVTLAKDGSKLSKDVFRGHYSIIECWTYL